MGKDDPQPTTYGMVQNLVSDVDGRSPGGAMLKAGIAVIALAIVPALADKQAFAAAVLVFGAVVVGVYYRIITSGYAPQQREKAEYDRKFQQAHILEEQQRQSRVGLAPV